MLRRVKAFFGDEELRAYLVIVMISTGLISLNTLYLYSGFSKSFEMAFFQVSNIITTTGFGYGDITNWPPLLPVYPSLPHGYRWLCWFNRRWTQGYSRSYPFKIAKIRFLSILSPHRVLTLHVNKTVIDKDTQHKILKYFVIYSMILLSLILLSA